MTFSDPHTAGQQTLLECNPPSAQPLCWKEQARGGNYPLFEWQGNCTVLRTGLPESDPENFEYAAVSECSNRGNCNKKLGACDCFEGHAGQACHSVLKMF